MRAPLSRPRAATARRRRRACLCLIQGACLSALFAVAACGDPPLYSRDGLSQHTGGDAGRDAGAGGTGGTPMSGSGGGVATGGASTGGVATGGTGASSTGGQGAHTGGSSSTGGTATGGTATGGTPTGGLATGGAPTGGLATGGMRTGGAATGGAATGGVATGGASTGGASTGGASTGGASTGGTTGGSATGGASAVLEPCAGLCTNPTAVELASGSFSSGGLGSGASCFQTKEPIAGGNCGNFVNPRTVQVNGSLEPCDSGGNWTSIPPARNGGHCIQVSAGGNSWAFFTLW